MDIKGMILPGCKADLAVIATLDNVLGYSNGTYSWGSWYASSLKHMENISAAQFSLVEGRRRRQ
jgi:hypothetical protein